MSQPPEKFQKARPRAKVKPARRVVLSAEDKAKYEALVNTDASDKTYALNVPVDRRRV